MPKYLIFLLISIVLWAILFFETIVSAMGIWYASATYNHCIFVIPISLYLIWQKVPLLLKEPINPSYLSLFAITGMMLFWGLGFAGSINVFQHVAVFSILPLIIVSSVGLKASRIIWFPLLFMLFSIPVGEELIPVFQEITADLSVQMLIWSGIPVFREGLFIQVPGGKFLVAEACSGIRFFISTVMLGSLCAFIFFSSTKKRIIFLVFSIVLPIIANAIRAYGIMLVGHLSGMEYAVEADHLIYGWVFFAIVTGLLIFVASYFKDKDKDKEKVDNENQEIAFSDTWATYPFKTYMTFFVIVFVGFFAWKLMITKSIESMMQVNTSSFSEVFDVSQSSSKMTSPFMWKPIFNKADLSFQAKAKYPDNAIGFNYFAFTGEGDGELISWENRVFDPEKWTIESSRNIEVEIENDLLKLNSLELFSNTGDSKTVIYWYQVPSLVSSNKLYIKIMQAMNVLVGLGRGGVFMSVSANGLDNHEPLLVWLQENYLQLKQTYVFSKDIQGIQQSSVAQ
tara:strand:+ start:567 stop:2099 length:1533 start_codon:yes stop_codon:yes gene_type:complete